MVTDLEWSTKLLQLTDNCGDYRNFGADLSPEVSIFPVLFVQIISKNLDDVMELLVFNEFLDFIKLESYKSTRIL
jgi:hypothetical protein